MPPHATFNPQNSVLLLPEARDVEGLRYVVWVAELLQAGRVGEGSPFHRMHEDCRHALAQRHRQRLDGRAGVLRMPGAAAAASGAAVSSLLMECAVEPLEGLVGRLRAGMLREASSDAAGPM